MPTTMPFPSKCSAPNCQSFPEPGQPRCRAHKRPRPTVQVMDGETGEDACYRFGVEAWRLDEGRISWPGTCPAPTPRAP